MPDDTKVVAKIPAALLERIKVEKDAIAKHRDQLRDLIDEISEIVGTADEAVIDLNNAVESLSKYV